MKRSIAITLLIVSAAFWIGRNLDKRIAAAGTASANLAEEARRAGVATTDTGRVAHRPSEAQLVAEAHAVATAYLNDPKARKPVIVPSHDVANEAEQRIRKLDARQMEILLEDLLTAMESDSEIAAERVTDMLREFARIRPRAALGLISAHAGVLRKSQQLGDVINEPLSYLAKDDGAGAVSWMREHAPSIPEAVGPGPVFSVFGEIAKVSPRAALELSSSLHLDESQTHDVLYSLISSARTNEARSAVLDALRECRDHKLGGKVAAGLVNQRIGDMGQRLAGEPFASASGWLDRAGLTDQEFGRICESLGGNYTNQGGKEPRLWIEWLGSHLSSGQRSSVERTLIGMMDSWAEQDYEAAGKWLAGAPDGRMKQAAVMGYVSAIAPHDLEAALQWVETLPDEQERTTMLKTIHYNLPKKTDADKQAAEAFAKEHGLE